MILSSLNHTLCPSIKLESFRGGSKTDLRPRRERFAENVGTIQRLFEIVRCVSGDLIGCDVPVASITDISAERQSI
jgi:hypothetical protein